MRVGVLKQPPCLPPTIITVAPNKRSRIWPSPRNSFAHRMGKRALRLKMGVTYPTRPKVMAVNPKSGAIPAMWEASKSKRGCARSPLKPASATFSSWQTAERNAAGVSRRTP